MPSRTSSPQRTSAPSPGNSRRPRAVAASSRCSAGTSSRSARAVSPLLAAVERAVPVTVHATLGADIIHQHPAADGAALGATSHRDFKRLAGSLPALHDGGVVLNVGSAVVMPEVFLKALTIA